MSRRAVWNVSSTLAQQLSKQRTHGSFEFTREVYSGLTKQDAAFNLEQKKGFAVPAAAMTQTATAQKAALQEITQDLYGAISLKEESAYQEGVYYNVDGQRFEDGRYAAFLNDCEAIIPSARQITDPVRTFAYGTDASFYRLNPKIVLKVHTEEEVAKILPIAKKHQVPITFRAAGTSLSGQALTDSVLIKLSHNGKNFRNFEVHGDGSSITLQPGLIGGEVNKILASYKKKNNLPVQYKIGPDPSSIDSCMIGGIVSNNSSGMCCGVSQNTYHTLRDMRIVLVDGTVLDTADPLSRQAFLSTHKDIVLAVTDLAKRVQADSELTSLIRRKFSIKCTTGYSLNALVDFPINDPIEIIKRLMIGSEGTFGFVSRVTYNTVPEWPNKASAFVLFPNVRDACEGAAVLRRETSVDAVEMFDGASLLECKKDENMVNLCPDIEHVNDWAGALLIECRGQDAEALKANIKEVVDALKNSPLKFGPNEKTLKAVETYPFIEDPKQTKVYWDVRKGLIPIVGAAREPGTSMLIEDVTCATDKLPDLTVDLIQMFRKYGYKDASCFGHALEGNLHLVFSQGFRNAEEVKRFEKLMDELCYIVATKHSGSLKGEHGTGRNIAPFVEMEWGTKAYEIMWELKNIFDPEFVLNPGVVLNKDENCHLKFLKPSPEANPLVNHCIECGFCESNCPSKDLTLTPRQRIGVYREINRLREIGDRRTPEQQARLDQFESQYVYQGDATCAADGMCQEKCPVKINTGELVKSLRADAMDNWKSANDFSIRVANNFKYFNYTVPYLLSAVDLAHRVVGPWPLKTVSEFLNKSSSNYIPAWNRFMPRGSTPLKQPLPPQVSAEAGIPRKVVYLASCVTRMMGPSLADDQREAVHDKLLSIFSKAGYEVIFPKGLQDTCCGMLFNTRGFKKAAALKGAELEAALMEASDGGKIPIVVDTSPCLGQIKTSLSEPSLRFALYEPVEFISTFLMDKLEFNKVKNTVAIHVPCSSKKMGIEDSFMKLASKCAHDVVPSGIPCCGMAGDRGMRFPELTASSLQNLSLPQNCSDGYSTSRTCEVSMSNHSGITFRGLVYLVDEATKPKKEMKA
eukprot:TRINITY_DN1193_c0_g1_i3.p1 TRINITY_DN1193_c0_g1~~TRINITY_DN1193_c0_g1_i3.p1  ORF type:complete len:1087 (-),score=151.26 TRINITY_DN1193_c0_g1_i3:409-3669(-)